MEALVGLFAILGVASLIPVLILYYSFSWGYVSTIFYAWFILPLYPDLQVFTIMQFAGIAMFIKCFIHPVTSISIKKEYREEKIQWVGMLHPWICLFTGWIIHLFY